MTKVAIIGAGISGLAAAIELKRNGITPVIYEEKHQVGSPVSYANVSLNFLFRPVSDQLKHLRQKYNLELQPVSDINILKIVGPNKQCAVSGHLGYSFLRGEEVTSIESQLASLLAYPIEFETHVKHEDILKKYDYLIVADGHGQWGRKLKIWQSTLRAWVRGATILGRFNPREMRVWFNNDYANSGYAYLVPMGHERASLVLIVTYTTHEELNQKWQCFLSTEKLNPEIIEEWDFEFKTGITYPHRVGNTFFVGASGGFIGSWLCLGLFPSLISGLEAAKSIARGTNYENEMKNYSHIMEQQFRLRQLWDKFDNKILDRAISFVDTFPVKYALFNSNIDVLKRGDSLINHLLRYKK